MTSVFSKLVTNYFWDQGGFAAPGPTRLGFPFVQVVEITVTPPGPVLRQNDFSSNSEKYPGFFSRKIPRVDNGRNQGASFAKLARTEPAAFRTWRKCENLISTDLSHVVYNMRISSALMENFWPQSFRDFEVETEIRSYLWLVKETLPAGLLWLHKSPSDFSTFQTTRLNTITIHLDKKPDKTR